MKESLVDLTSNELVSIYQLMLLSRRFNERAIRWYKEGRIPQGMHPSIGQEAVGVGACYGLRASDWVVPSLRTAEAFWTRGVTVLEQLNAMMGNTESVSRGKETSHHAGYPDHGILAGTGIVGGSIPVATGAALALRMRGTDGVMVCFFGDGAANRGDFHEALNLAAVLKAPVIYVCENNSYAQTVPTSAVTAISDLAERASGYGIPGRIVDGQDVLAVYAVTQEAVLRARGGGGPSFLECKTYRFEPHYPIFEEDRPREEIETWLKRDPIALLGTRLRKMELLDDGRINEMEETIRQELDAAIAQAEATPPPEPEEVFSQIFAEPFDETER